MNEKIELKLIIDGKEAITTLNLTDENLKKLVTGFDRVRGASTKSSLDIAAAWGSVTMGINQAMMLAERFYGIISAPIKVAGQFEAYETQLKVMLGSAEAAKERLAELQEFAATTPFTLPQVVEAGNQLQAMNRYSIETVRQLGDLAAASGKPFDQVMNAYAKLVSGQKGIAIDMFRDLLITSDDWAKATGAKFSKSGEIMVKAEDMAKALPKILKEKGFDGMMAEQSRTLNGMVSNMEDAFTKLEQNIGEKLLPLTKEFIDDNTKILNTYNQTLNNVSKSVDMFIQRMEISSEKLKAIKTTITTTADLLLRGSGIYSVYAGLRDAADDIEELSERARAAEIFKLEVQDGLRALMEWRKELISAGKDTLLVDTYIRAQINDIKKDMSQKGWWKASTDELILSAQKMIGDVKDDVKNNPVVVPIVTETTTGVGNKKTSKADKSGINIEIFNAKQLAEIERRLNEEKLKAIQQAEASALAIIQSSIEQEFALRRNHAKATITDKQQLEAALAVIDKQEFERKRQLLTDQLSEIKTNTTLEKDERELKERELLTAITTVEGQILDVKREASNKAIDLAEREAEFRKQTMKQILGDTGNLFGQLYGRAQEDERREIESEKKKRTAAIETERKKRLEHAVTQQEKDRINQEYDARLQQMEDQYEQRQKEAGVEMFYMQQHMAAVQALINTYEAATKAYAQGGAIFGPPLAAMITALGLAQVAMIESQEPPGYIRGGLVEGSAGVDSNVIRVTNGEYVINPDATSRYINVLDAINNDREFKIPVSADRNSELTTEIRLLRQENRRLLSQQLKAFSRPHKIKAGIDRYETAAIVETAETLINKRKA